VRARARGIDLTDVGRRRALFARIGAAASQVLVVSEGLLIYLTPEQVAALAGDLARAGTVRGGSSISGHRGCSR